MKKSTICLKRNEIAKKIQADLNLSVETKYKVIIRNKVIREVFKSKPPL